MMLTKMILMKLTKQAASENQEPSGGEVAREVGEEEGEKKKKEEEEVANVVENGGIPGPTMVVQSRTIRFPISSNIKVASTKNE